jgi:hypothetical protein
LKCDSPFLRFFVALLLSEFDIGKRFRTYCESPATPGSLFEYARMRCGMNFMCRDCAGLSYECRRLDRSNRALLQARKIRMKLGGSPAVTDPFPPRPKGMHRTTYARLNAKAEELCLKWDPTGTWRSAKKTSPAGR